MRMVILSIMLAFLSLTLTAQTENKNQGIEAIITQLEQEQVRLLLAGNTEAMAARWSPNFTVNNPFDKIVEGEEGPIQSGDLTYTKFVRSIERFVIDEDLVAVMGREFVVPKKAPAGSSHVPSKEIERRFTNVWVKKNGEWLLFARHANVLCD
jgi:hypothetical protein